MLFNTEQYKRAFELLTKAVIERNREVLEGLAEYDNQNKKPLIR